MSNFLRRSAQGAGVPHEKGTSNLETVAMPLPSKIVLSMGQHIGAPAAPAVAKGDQVYVGTVVGKAGGFVSADIHSGVSGTVTEITTITAPNGAAQQAVVITTDGQQTVDPSIDPPQVTDMKSFVEAVRASGLVGLGGAGFPTAVKLSPKNLDEIDMLVINGAECEPYITSDNRCFIEDTHHVLNGIKQVMKYLNIAKCVIGIEGNKPEAIAKMKSAIDDPAIETVAVSIQEVTYDQGQEIRRELRRLTAERSEFLTRDGRTFFWLMEVQDGERDPEQIIQPVLIAWGEDGTVVAEFTIRQESFASYG